MYFPTQVSLLAKKVAKHFPMGLYVLHLGERECHHVEKVTHKVVKFEPSTVGSAISRLNKHGTILGICFHCGYFGILEVKSARDQTSRKIEARVWVAEAVKQVRDRATEIDCMA